MTSSSASQANNFRGAPSGVLRNFQAPISTQASGNTAEGAAAGSNQEGESSGFGDVDPNALARSHMLPGDAGYQNVTHQSASDQIALIHAQAEAQSLNQAPWLQLMHKQMVFQLASQILLPLANLFAGGAGKLFGNRRAANGDCSDGSCNRGAGGGQASDSSGGINKKANGPANNCPDGSCSQASSTSIRAWQQQPRTLVASNNNSNPIKPESSFIPRQNDPIRQKSSLDEPIVKVESEQAPDNSMIVAESEEASTIDTTITNSTDDYDEKV